VTLFNLDRVAAELAIARKEAMVVAALWESNQGFQWRHELR
jgi:hypothetical protein